MRSKKGKECIDVSAVVYAIGVSIVICFGFHLGNAFCPQKNTFISNSR